MAGLYELTPAVSGTLGTFVTFGLRHCAPVAWAQPTLALERGSRLSCHLKVRHIHVSSSYGCRAGRGGAGKGRACYEYSWLGIWFVLYSWLVYYLGFMCTDQGSSLGPMGTGSLTHSDT